jgi:hypothetical protein
MALLGLGALGPVSLGGCASARSSRPGGVAPSTEAPAAEAGEFEFDDDGDGQPRLRWTIALQAGGDVDVGVVSTRLCFPGAPPARVGPEYGPALRYLADIPQVVDPQGRPLGRRLQVVDDGRAGIDTAGVPAGACVAFDVDVEAAADAIDNRDLAKVVGRSLLISPDVWLWRPKPWPAGHTAGVLRVDDEGRVAVPFPRTGPGQFEVRSSAFALQSYTALGDFSTRRRIMARGADLDVVFVDRGALGDDELVGWIQTAIDDVAVPMLRFPVTRATMLVVPVAGARPVVAGFLGRGGGASALFLVGRGPLHVEADPEIIDLEGRWVLTHELAHALLPPVARGDAWLNEGITTWNQEVLPASAGRRDRELSAAQLRIGFRTGARRAERDGLSLERSCTQMDRMHSYQHCYWGGAALVQLLSEELGDDAVYALIRGIWATGPVDGRPRRATDLLEAVKTSATEPASRAAAAALLRLWHRHKGNLFPPVSAGDVGEMSVGEQLPTTDGDA